MKNLLFSSFGWVEKDFNTEAVSWCMHGGEGERKGGLGKLLTNIFQFLRHVHKSPQCFSRSVLFRFQEVNAITHFPRLDWNGGECPECHWLALLSCGVCAALKHLRGTQENDSIFSAACGNMELCHEIMIEVHILPPLHSLVAEGQEAMCQWVYTFPLDIHFCWLIQANFRALFER